jgi:hypothetical protein
MMMKPVEKNRIAFPTTKIRKKTRYFTVWGSMPEEACVRITRRFL